MRSHLLYKSFAVLISAPLIIFVQAQVANADCREFPASTTPACVAQNLAEEQTRQAAEEARRAKEIVEAEKRAQEQAQRDFVAGGSRECSVYPASISPSCVAENLEYEAKRQVEQQAKTEAEMLEAEERALKQSQEDFIRNGSRVCSLYPASLTQECIAENLEYEESKQIEIAALTAARELTTKSLITTKDEKGSLLVAGNIPKGVDLLNTRVRLLNSKGKLVDQGEIRYDSAGRPYLVFDKQVNKGNYKIEFTIPKKKPGIVSIKL